MAKRIGFCFLGVVLLFSLRISAQQTYGTQNEIAYVIQAAAFMPLATNIGYLGTIDGRYVNNNNGCCLVASVSLPSGASVIGLEAEGCDSSPTGDIGATFQICADGCTGVGPAVTTSGPPPGCGRFRSNFLAPITVNATESFAIRFSNQGDLGGNVSLYAARVYYKLQVSPDPATATFTDVPVGHPYHRFVEALAAAGITGGCGGGNYCPDAPITRGQMAVFLAGALGLHWTP